MLWTAFIVGLAGSTHCIGMCGPIALAIPFKYQWNILAYHLGRIIMYGILGLLLGILGRGLWVVGIQNQISIAVGIAMILGAVFNYFSPSLLSSLTVYHRFVAFLKKSMNSLLRKKGVWAIFFLGGLNGLLPCGLVYLALAGAFTTEGVLGGSVYMVLFGLGTLPLMGLISYSGNLVRGKWNAFFKKISPILLLLFGLFLIARGFKISLPDTFRLNPEIIESPMCH
jgi:uncharacterized protein